PAHGDDGEAPGAGRRARRQGHGAAQPTRPRDGEEAQGLRRRHASARRSAARTVDDRGLKGAPMTTTTTKPLTGRRKEAGARVRLTPGTGTMTVNGKPVLEYLRRETLVLHALQPLVATNLRDKLDLQARVAGGGLSGQAGAIRMAVARALVRQDEALKALLGRAGFLTRDSRMVERKKYG